MTPVGVSGDIQGAVQADGITTLRVVQSGDTVLAIGPQDAPLPISSIRKSIISALFGRLIASGSVQLDNSGPDRPADPVRVIRLPVVDHRRR
jgi:hypothetical protein